MKGTESGTDKVKKICEALRKETLEPAMVEAEEIISQAREEAQRIVKEAQRQSDMLFDEAKERINREKEIFHTALNQASKLVVQYLRQTIEEKLFNRELAKQLSSTLQNPKILADLITAVVKAIEKEGRDVDLSAYIPSVIPARDVNAFLAKDIIDKLKEKSVLIAPIGGGIEVKLRNENVTLDLSDTALNELIANYIRKDFRELFFEGVHQAKK